MAKEDKDKQTDMADDMLIREVDDELRAERLQNWWQRFGSLLVGSCVTIILATIAYQLATSYRISQAEERTAILLEAQSFADKKQYDTALKKLSPLTEEASDASHMAQLQAAYLEQKQAKETAKNYEKIAQQSEHSAIRDVARLQANAWNTIDANSPFYSLAGEQKVISLLRENKKDEAKTILLSLLDLQTLPADQRQRLNELLQGVN